eukprot:366068-Chlamydomonas_euryale.AAC.2
MCWSKVWNICGSALGKGPGRDAHAQQLVSTRAAWHVHVQDACGVACACAGRMRRGMCMCRTHAAWHVHVQDACGMACACKDCMWTGSAASRTLPPAATRHCPQPWPNTYRTGKGVRSQMSHGTGGLRPRHSSMHPRSHLPTLPRPHGHDPHANSRPPK